MSGRRVPVSLVAERAVRYLRHLDEPATSVELAREVLATRVPSEKQARALLEEAFGHDPRLAYTRGRWRTSTVPTPPTRGRKRPPEPDRTLLLIRGARPARGRPFELHAVAAIRLEGDTVVAACGGQPSRGAENADLRREMLRALEGAVPIMHDPPGALAALERWLGQPLVGSLSLRRLAMRRLGLPAGHTFETLAERLKLTWRDTDDPLDVAEAMDLCLQALLRPSETIEDLRREAEKSAPPVPWDRMAFGPRDLRAVPETAGTYRFYDRRGRLIYVGKSKNLRNRLLSYFRSGGKRSARVQAILDEVHRFEVEPVGSELEAVLREAQQIRKGRPARNVQRKVHTRSRGVARLRSLLILEPAVAPKVLWAYLVHDGRLIERVAVGPRGGGLARIRRTLENRFFLAPDGPVPAGRGTEVNTEMVARWLAANRDQVVAFDPTDLKNADEVINRLWLFLRQ